MHTPNATLWKLPPSLRTLVEAELNPREKITWIGRPIPRRFAIISIPIVLFGIPWTAFALYWMAGGAFPKYDLM